VSVRGRDPYSLATDPVPALVTANQLRPGDVPQWNSLLFSVCTLIASKEILRSFFTSSPPTPLHAQKLPSRPAQHNNQQQQKGRHARADQYPDVARKPAGGSYSVDCAT